MTESRPQRLANVGVGRLLAYGVLVGGAAYLTALAYAPTGFVGRVLIALLLGAGYVATVHAFDVLRRRRPTD